VYLNHLRPLVCSTFAPFDESVPQPYCLNLPPQSKQGWEQVTPDFWHHTHLQLQNHTSQHLRVTFDDTTVLSPKSETLQGTAFATLGVLGSTTQPTKIQQNAWLIGDRQQQSALAYLGFYQGQIDGLTGPATKSAIKKFQTSQELPQTAEFDAPTTERLHKAVNDKRLTELNGANRQISVATVTYTPENTSGKYTLSFGPSQVPFATDNPAILAHHLNAYLVDSARKSIYVDLDSFPLDKGKALASNLRRQQRLMDDSIDVHGVSRSEEDPQLQTLLFEGVTKVETRDVRVEQRGGFFRATIDLLVYIGNTVHRLSIAIVSSTREYAVELAQLIGMRARTQHAFPVAPGVYTGMSVAEIVSAAERDFRSRHPEITDEAYSK
jgi:Putative peptidoglycan binding domain